MIQSCRGTFGSGGDWEPFRNEQRDGKATHDWIASQPWFDGQLVTFGPSYLGLTQWAVAEDPHPSLRGMALTVTASNFRDAIIYPGGSFSLETGLTWIHEVSNQELGNRHRAKTMFTGAGPKAVAKGASVLPLSASGKAATGKQVDFFQDWLTHDEPGDAWW